MELAVITAKQVAELLLMILAGAVCCKAGVFKPKEKSVLANLLLYLVVPAMVLDSYMVEYDPATFHNLMLAFGLGALVLLVGLGVAFLASFKVQKDARAILWFACAFSNAGYMGFPLIKALFGGEGFIMQKLSGFGKAFIEIDGHAVEYDLRPGQSIVVDTGYLAAMSATCTMDIQSVRGVKNVLFGGEGFFNTVVTGPGKVLLQTMPINAVAGSIAPYIPSGGKN